MRKCFKKLAAAFVAASVVFGLAACGSGTNDKQADSLQTTKEQPADGQTQQEEDDSIDISKITFPLEEKVTLTAFVYASNSGGGYMVDNYVTHWIEEQTNVKIDFVYDLDGEEAGTRLNLLMTDPDSMPDIFIRTGWTKGALTLYGQQGLVIPLNKYLKTAKNWNAMNESSPMREGDLTMTDGNIYSFGSVGECYSCLYSNRLWVYKPWIDQFNDGKMPETLDELYDYMVKIKNCDANGNGIADEIPVSGFIGGWATDPTMYFVNSFLNCNNTLSAVSVGGWAVDNGKLKYQLVDERYKDALTFLNKIYAEGLLDNQLFTQDQQQFSALMNGDENKVALHAGGLMWGGIANLGVAPGDYQNWVALAPVEGPDGVRYAPTGQTSYFGGCNGVISKNCKNPEIAVALFDWLLNEEASLVQSYGPEGIGWDYVDGGPDVVGGNNARFKIYTFDTTTIDWSQYGYDPDNLPFNPNHIDYPSSSIIARFNVDLFNAQAAENPEIELVPLLNIAASVYEPYAIPSDMLVPNLAFTEEASKKISDYTVTICGYANQASVQFITGELDIETGWDDYVNKMYQMGLEDFTNIYQEAYDQYMAGLQKESAE